jgi:hypothetical protein
MEHTGYARGHAESDCCQGKCGIRPYLQMVDVVQRFASFGSRPIGGTPEDVAAFLKDERVRWQAAVEAAKITKGQFD